MHWALRPCDSVKMIGFVQNWFIVYLLVYIPKRFCLFLFPFLSDFANCISLWFGRSEGFWYISKYSPFKFFGCFPILYWEMLEIRGAIYLWEKVMQIWREGIYFTLSRISSKTIFLFFGCKEAKICKDPLDNVLVSYLVKDMEFVRNKNVRPLQFWGKKKLQRLR